ncbi:MAG: HlyD family efflux transporter periplasmic adaptor subunit [Burkholderiaceae bacterium]
MDKAGFPAPAAMDAEQRASAARQTHLGAWLHLTCTGIAGTTASIVVVAGKEPGDFELVASWPNQPAGLHLVGASERCLSTGQVVQQDDTSPIVVATPLISNGRVQGALVLQAGTEPLSAREIRTAVVVASRYLNQVILGHINPAEDAGRAYMQAQKTLLQLVCRPDVFTKAALETVNWAAAEFGCKRVALGVVRRNVVRLQALSHSAWFDPKSQGVIALENAMEEALDQRRSVVLPAAGTRTAITIAHRDAANGDAVCSVILAGGDGLGVGVLYLERQPALPFAPAEVDALEELGQLIGPVLEAKDMAHRWIGGRTRNAWRTFVERLRDPRRPALRVGMVLAGAAIAALTLIDTAWRVSADASIEGEQQRVIPAPFDGFIASASVKAGLVVKKGQTLATLDQRQTQLDVRRWTAEESQHESRYRDALTKHDRAAAAMSRAQLQQAQAQRALAEDRLGKALLIAPFDAFVVSGDLSQQIGSPVEQGKVLFELAPLDSYRVVVKVDERDIRAVKVGQSGTLVLSGLTESRLPFRVENISVPQAGDGRNVFRVEAQLKEAGTALRPGMQGVAKILVGERSLLWIWTHSAWDWLRLQAWKWSP